MTTSDILFKDIVLDINTDYNSFSYFGWEGKDTFALFKFADSYYMGAVYLVEKFNVSGGHNDILDGLGLPICFLYRHYTELHLKYLIRKFGNKTDNDYKELLSKGHNLNELWKLLKPILKSNKDRVGSSVDIGCLEHYINEIHTFDSNSMTVRYPLNKKLQQNNYEIRLNVNNLHDRMDEFHSALLQIECDIDNQLKEEVDSNLVSQYLDAFNRRKTDISDLLSKTKDIADKEPKEIVFRPFDDLGGILTDQDEMKILIETLDDEMLVLLESLCYTGRDIYQNRLVLPKNKQEAVVDTVKSCVLDMQRNNLGFGTPIHLHININFVGMMASSILLYINSAYEIIAFDR